MSIGSDALRLVSGVGTKGPACFVLETAGRRLMLDLGEGPPPGVLPNVTGVGRIDALILSHGHRDHVGGLTLLSKLGDPPIYATDIVASALPKGLNTRCLPVHGTGEVLGIEVTTGRNGHAPGGVWLHFAIGGGFLYTGDWSMESILYGYDPPAKPAAVALVDCSYAAHNKPIAACWAELATLIERGPLLLPVPANGRGPEIALELGRRGFAGAIFIDDAMQQALQQLSGSASISLREGIAGELEQLAARARPIEEPRGVMLAASADGSSGTSAQLIARWEHAREPGIVFTGYVPPRTPAERLVKSGRGQFARWNVHPRITDTVALVRAIGARTVVPAFCDRAQLPALAQALAPVRVTMDGPVIL